PTHAVPPATPPRARATAAAIRVATAWPSATRSVRGEEHGHALSGLRAEVRGAGHQAVHVLLPRAVHRHADAALLPVGDPGRAVPARARHGLLRRRRAAARGAQVGEPGGDAEPRGGEGRGRPGGADLAPALGPLGRLSVLPRRALLATEGGDGVLDGLRRPVRALPHVPRRPCAWWRARRRCCRASPRTGWAATPRDSRWCRWRPPRARWC